MKILHSLLFLIACLTTPLLSNTPSNFKTQQYTDSLSQLAISKSVSAPDTTLQLLEKCVSISKDKHDTLNTITSLHTLSYYYIMYLDYVSAYETIWDALQLSEKSNDSINMSASYEMLSELYAIYSQQKHSSHYINKAISINKQLLKNNKTDTVKLITNYFKASNNNRVLERFETALAYIDSCLALSNLINQDTIHKSYIYSERAFLLTMKGDYDEAHELLQDVKNVFESLDANDPKNVIHNNYLVFVYAYMGTLYAELNLLHQSKEYFKRSLKFMEQKNAHTGLKPYVFYQLSLVLGRLHKMEEAFETMHSSKLIYDSLYGIKSDQNIKLLEIKSNYEEEIQLKNETLYQNTKLLAAKERTLFKIRIVLFILFFSIITGVLIVKNKNQRIRYKHDKETAARENKLNEQAAHNLLEVKNKELTTYTLQFIEKDKTIKEMAELLKGDKDQKTINSYLKRIQIDQNIWDEFSHRFNSVNSGFYERLSKQFPNLSPTEKKHCALIKLNFTGKEMAHLLGISTSSVHISRHRLRKKMNLDRSTDLSSFIAKI